jgi:thiol-disulfide isomerase/thioredoxin
MSTQITLTIPDNVYQQAPDFTLQGETVDITLNAFKGKVVLLDFWASWCAPCRASFPWMNEMQNRYRSQGLVVIAINLDKDRALADHFLSKTPAEFTLAFDPKGEVASRYGLKGMPSSFLIDKQGQIVKSHIGFFHSEEEKRELEIKKVLNL